AIGADFRDGSENGGPRLRCRQKVRGLLHASSAVLLQVWARRRRSPFSFSNVVRAAACVTGKVRSVTAKRNQIEHRNLVGNGHAFSQAGPRTHVRGSTGSSSLERKFGGN